MSRRSVSLGTTSEHREDLTDEPFLIRLARRRMLLTSRRPQKSLREIFSSRRKWYDAHMRKRVEGKR